MTGDEFKEVAHLYDADADDLIDVTTRWKRDVQIRAMWEALTMVGIKYKRKVELLCDRFCLGERALANIVKIRHPARDGQSASAVKRR